MTFSIPESEGRKSNTFIFVRQKLAHRVLPQVLVQEIKITNMRNSAFNIELASGLASDWPSSNTRSLR